MAARGSAEGVRKSLNAESDPERSYGNFTIYAPVGPNRWLVDSADDGPFCNIPSCCIPSAIGLSRCGTGATSYHLQGQCAHFEPLHPRDQSHGFIQRDRCKPLKHHHPETIGVYTHAAFNKKNKPLIPTTSLFPDPYDLDVLTDQLTIECYGYRDPVPDSDLDKTKTAVSKDLWRKIYTQHQERTPMGTSKPYLWSSSDVYISLHPDERLTRGQCLLAPVQMKRFLKDNGLRGMQFVLLWHGLGPVGYGQLVCGSCGGVGGGSVAGS